MCTDESEMEPRQAKMSQERSRYGEDDGAGRQNGAKMGPKWAKMGQDGARTKLALKAPKIT